MKRAYIEVWVVCVNCSGNLRRMGDGDQKIGGGGDPCPRHIFSQIPTVLDLGVRGSEYGRKGRVVEKTKSMTVRDYYAYVWSVY